MLNWNEAKVAAVVVGIGMLLLIVFLQLGGAEELQKDIEELQKNIEELQQEKFCLKAELTDTEYMKDFFVSYGKLINLIDEKQIRNGIPVVTTEEGTLPIGREKDRVNAMTQMPIYLYFPNASEISLHFKVDLKAFQNEWQISAFLPNGKEEEVTPDSDKENYFYLELKERGTYFVDISDPNDDENHQYFSLQW